MRKLTICLSLGLLMMLVAMSTQAQEAQPTEREKELLNRIEELEKRVWQLESESKETKAAPPKVPAELESRVEDVEKKVDVGLEKLGAVEEQVKQIEPVEPKPDTFRVFWKEGLNLATPDSAFKMKIGGRIMADWAWLSGDDELAEEVGDLEGGVEFRRARFYISGDIYDNVNFKAQYDFAGGDADFKDVWLGIKKLPWGAMKIGHFKEPFSLEELTSSKYITFMERSLPVEGFAPSRNMGIMLYNDALDERLTWAAGGFKDADDFGIAEGEGNWVGTFRLTGLPWYEDKGQRLLHLGAAYSYRSIDEELRYRSRPEVHLAPRFVNTDHFPADNASLFGAEAALVLGPFSLQGEYMHSAVDSAEAMDPGFSGFYAMASYFLTGEHRPYKTTEGAFSRVKPKKNFGAGGPGAWEIAARYSHLDLNDEEIEGGELDDITVGLNWYLNPNTRFMLNYVHADLDEVGQSDTFQMRAQIDF